MQLKITDDALNYLMHHLNLEHDKNLIIYISVAYPYTQYAYVNITYCKKTDINKTDIKFNIKNINIYIDEKSKDLLHASTIDLKNESLQINAPNLLKSKEINNQNIEDEIKILFENEINTVLSQHGGFIELMEIEQSDTLIIKFHGGCQGCGMVNYTMNNYIEKIVKKNFPQIKRIKDITSHDIKKNSYY